MTIASIEQSRAAGARPNGDAGTANAGDPAGLFALLMATLGMPLQIVGAANAQTPASPSTRQNGGADVTLDAIDSNATNNNGAQTAASPLPLPAANTVPVMASQLPATATLENDRPGQLNFADLAGPAELAGSAAPGPVVSATPSRSTSPASEPKIGAADTNGAPTTPVPNFVPTAPVVTPVETNKLATPEPVRAHPAVNAPNDVIVADPAGNRSIMPDFASIHAESRDLAAIADRAAADKSLAASAATSRALSDFQVDIADTAPVPTALRRDPTIVGERANDAGSDRAVIGKTSHVTTVELPSVAVGAIEQKPTAPLLPEQPAVPGATFETRDSTTAVAAVAPGSFAQANDTPDLDEASRPIDPIGTRSIDLSTMSRPLPGGEATPLRPETAAPPVAAERTALQHVGAHITRAIADGTDRLILHLVPAELGRIDIALDVREDGQVKATIRVDNPTTLDLLQRDSRNLERALESAGLRAEAGSLNFSLRNDGRQSQPFNPSPNGQAGNDAPVEDELGASLVSQTRSAARGLVDLTI